MTFQLLQPTSLSEACALLAVAPDDAVPVAGGTDLLSEIRDGTATPATLVALDAVSDANLAGITDAPDGGLRIGALATIADIAAHDGIRSRYAALSQAAAGLANPQVRNLGTLGGNLNQRPRCWYYRHPLTVCLKRGGDRCFAVQGVGKYLCVTGGDRCFIVHPSDTAVALTALGASLTIASPDGQRTVAIADYFVGPDVDISRENILQPGELLTSATLPPPIDGQRSVYLKAPRARVGRLRPGQRRRRPYCRRRRRRGGLGGTGRRCSDAVPCGRDRGVPARSVSFGCVVLGCGCRGNRQPQDPARQRLQAPHGVQPYGPRHLHPTGHTIDSVVERSAPTWHSR